MNYAEFSGAKVMENSRLGDGGFILYRCYATNGKGVLPICISKLSYSTLLFKIYSRFRLFVRAFEQP